jgi:hypothetical protein
MNNQNLTNQKVDLLTSKVPNWNGRTLSNIGKPTQANDAVRLSDLQDLQSKIEKALGVKLS